MNKHKYYFTLIRTIVEESFRRCLFTQAIRFISIRWIERNFRWMCFFPVLSNSNSFCIWLKRELNSTRRSMKIVLVYSELGGMNILFQWLFVDARMCVSRKSQCQILSGRYIASWCHWHAKAVNTRTMNANSLWERQFEMAYINKTFDRKRERKICMDYYVLWMYVDFLSFFSMIGL